MPGLFSSEEKSEKLAALRQEFPYLEGVLDTFRDNELQSKDVIAIINRKKAGITLPGPLAQKFASLDDRQKERITASANALCDAYAEFYEERRLDGIDLQARDALEGLEGDIHKICNFDFRTPHHAARAGIEKFFRTEMEGPDAQGTAVTPLTDEPEQDVQKDNMRTLAASAGVISGVVAAAEAGKHWRERHNKPDSSRKAMAFAVVSAVSMAGVATALMLSRMGGISR